MTSLVRRLGRGGIGIVQVMGNFALFTGDSFLGLVGARRLPRELTRCLFEQGVKCVPVVAIVGLFAGLVLGLEGYHVLSRFGSEGLLGSFVGLTLTRELAPVLAALVIIGQSGSAVAAELGIQRNSEQIDALDTMGVGTLGYLVAPRLLAGLIAYPILTVLFTFLGLVGSFVSGCIGKGLDRGVFWGAVQSSIQSRDVLECLAKALAFGLLAVAICCHSGFNTHRRTGVTGARAVSASTTRGVVLASIAVLVADYALTAAFV